MEFRRLFLKTSQLPGSLFFRAASYEFPPTSSLSNLKSALRTTTLDVTLPAFSDNFKCHHFTVAAAKAVINPKSILPYSCVVDLTEQLC